MIGSAPALGGLTCPVDTVAAGWAATLERPSARDAAPRTTHAAGDSTGAAGTDPATPRRPPTATGGVAARAAWGTGAVFGDTADVTATAADDRTPDIDGAATAAGAADAVGSTIAAAGAGRAGWGVAGPDGVACGRAACGRAAMARSDRGTPADSAATGFRSWRDLGTGEGTDAAAGRADWGRRSCEPPRWPPRVCEGLAAGAESLGAAVVSEGSADAVPVPPAAIAAPTPNAIASPPARPNRAVDTIAAPSPELSW